MWFQGTFEALKIYQRKDRICIEREQVVGELLITLLYNTKYIPKKQFYQWIKSICIQLDEYHMVHQIAYQQINPYTIIITNKNEIRLLDLHAQTSQEIVLYLQEKNIHQFFNKLLGIRRLKIKSDFYSIGKTIQFVIAHSNLKKDLHLLETHCISHALKRCAVEIDIYQYENMYELYKAIARGSYIFHK